MKKEYIKVDKDGRVALLNPQLPFNERPFEKQIFNIDDDIPENFIGEPIPDGLYYPKWTESGWVESMTQKEIDELNNQPREPFENEILRDYLLDVDFRLIMLELGGL